MKATQRTIPEWTLKGNLKIEKEEQLHPSVSSISQEEFGRIKLYRACRGRWTQVNQLFDILRSIDKDEHLLSADCINDLLSFSDEFPEEWKGREIQLWGSIYRDEKGYAHIKYLRYNSENELWLVGDRTLHGNWGQYEAKPIGQLVGAFHPESQWYVAWIKK